MKNSPLNLVFMGTPEIASESLSAILDQSDSKILDLKCIYTKPATWNSKKKEFLFSPVYNIGSDLNIKVLTPKILKNNAIEIEYLKSLNLDLIIVVAFGLILPVEILSIPKFGVLNLHPSLLPELRGPSPIHFSILDRLKYTGVSIMAMDAGIDSGPVIAQNKTEIKPDDYYEDLYGRLSYHGALLLKEVIKTVYNFRLHVYDIGYPQNFENEDATRRRDVRQPSMSRMIEPKDRIVNFIEDDPLEIYVKIRAFSELGGAVFAFNNKNIGLIKAKILINDEEFADGLSNNGSEISKIDKSHNAKTSEKYYNYIDYTCNLSMERCGSIFRLKKEYAAFEFKPGMAVCSDKTGLIVKTIKIGVYLSILTVKPEGKNIMGYSDFINGYRIKQGDILQ